MGVKSRQKCHFRWQICPEISFLSILWIMVSYGPTCMYGLTLDEKCASLSDFGSNEGEK